MKSIKNTGNKTKPGEQPEAISRPSLVISRKPTEAIIPEPTTTEALQEEYKGEDAPLRYSVSLVTQGNHRFYTLTVPSDVLGKTCFVTTREEDAEEGFQRVLDKDRAQQIADYVDTGFGTIPTSIVLSAQSAAELRPVGKGKTVEFKAAPKAFLVLDGQHRVYGFKLAKTKLRVPVVIYNGLSKRDESRLFIDINTKQRPVPNELLLDMKKLAEYENDAEKLFREVFDLFESEPGSPLFDMMSRAARTGGKISRVTFNVALKPLLAVFEGKESDQVYRVLEAYVRSFADSCERLGAKRAIANPTVFRAMMQLFREVGARVKDRGREYSTDNFSAVLLPVFRSVRAADLLKPSRSHLELFELLSKSRLVSRICG
jgi:DGQHR domain-containing protein